MSTTADSIFWFTILPTQNSTVRNTVWDTPKYRGKADANTKLMSLMNDVSRLTYSREPGVLEFCLVVPRVDDHKTMWSIEQ